MLARGVSGVALRENLLRLKYKAAQQCYISKTFQYVTNKHIIGIISNFKFFQNG